MLIQTYDFLFILSVVKDSSSIFKVKTNRSIDCVLDIFFRAQLFSLSSLLVFYNQE